MLRCQTAVNLNMMVEGRAAARVCTLERLLGARRDSGVQREAGTWCPKIVLSAVEGDMRRAGTREVPRGGRTGSGCGATPVGLAGISTSGRQGLQAPSRDKPRCEDMSRPRIRPHREGRDRTSMGSGGRCGVTRRIAPPARYVRRDVDLWRARRRKGASCPPSSTPGPHCPRVAPGSVWPQGPHRPTLRESPWARGASLTATGVMDDGNLLLRPSLRCDAPQRGLLSDGLRMPAARQRVEAAHILCRRRLRRPRFRIDNHQDKQGQNWNHPGFRFVSTRQVFADAT